MSKQTRGGFVFVSVILVFLSAGPFLSADKRDSAGTSYQNAVDYFGDLNLNSAYEWADSVVQNFPGTEEAEKAVLLKAVVSTVRLQTYDILSKRYAEGMRKAAIYNNKQENREFFIEKTQKAIEAGVVLVKDASALFEYAGRPMSVEYKKNYDSLTLLKRAFVPYRMLGNGYPPTKRERELIKKHQSDMSYIFVVSRLLRTPSQDEEQIAKDFEKRQVIKGNVNWPRLMMAMGDWLIHYASICKVGWIHPVLNTRTQDLKKAKAGYETARRCFENALELSSEAQLSGREEVRARQRIKEIDSVLDKME